MPDRGKYVHLRGLRKDSVFVWCLYAQKYDWAVYGAGFGWNSVSTGVFVFAGMLKRMYAMCVWGWLWCVTYEKGLDLCEG